MRAYINKLQEKGFVLLILLIFMQVFALISLASITHNRLAFHWINYHFQKQILLFSAENALKTVSVNLRTYLPPCLTPPIENSKIIHFNESWWKETSCAGNFQHLQYYYVIENFGHNNCTFILTERNKVAYFYRITLLMMGQQHDPTVILQALYRKADKPTAICKERPSFVNEGIDMIHELV